MTKEQARAKRFREFLRNHPDLNPGEISGGNPDEFWASTFRHNWQRFNQEFEAQEFIRESVTSEKNAQRARARKLNVQGKKALDASRSKISDKSSRKDQQ
jgi:hypothetical protein